MSVFSGGDKYYRQAEGVDARSYNIEAEIGYTQSNRELLSQIRKARLAAANDAYMSDQTSGEYIQQSSASSAVNNIYSTLGGAYSFSTDLNQMNANLEQSEIYSQVLKKKAATADKRAATATQITMAVFALAGGFAYGGLGMIAGAALGKAAVSAMSPGKVARKTSTKAAVQYGITGATMAVGNAFGSTTNAAPASTTKSGGVVSSSGGSVGGELGSVKAAHAQQAATATSQAVSGSSWLSTAKDIGGYLSTAKEILTPDYEYSDRYANNALYNMRRARIYGGY